MSTPVKQKAAHAEGQAALLKTSNDTAPHGIRQQAKRAIIQWLLNRKCALCDLLCGDMFFNRHASLEIDRLTVEVENLRARLHESKRVNRDIEQHPDQEQA